jgi:hypothetical protein
MVKHTQREHEMIAKPERPEEGIRVADEAWVGLALLHRENPDVESFTAREILERVKTEGATSQLRPGVQVHIYLHNVANIEPNSARYRMFWRLPNDTYRLFRPGDHPHSSRRGKTKPERDELPEQYRYLLDWYEQRYCAKENGAKEEDDPILQMRGVGKEIWRDTDADEYVRGLRSNWYGDERPEK